MFTLSNVKNIDSIGVNQSNKTVTFKADNLTSKNISNSTTKTAGSFTKFASGSATFKTSSFSDFYSLKNNQVIYAAPSGGKTITIKNLKSLTTLDAVKSGITITELKNGSCKVTFKSYDLFTTKAPVISVTASYR
ncbi:MAG: hypothetical protein IJQ82_06735 [Selenomonadaceae bacterium]|nr:hypothetical protein [Selenomonadaceae bacterium]